MKEQDEKEASHLNSQFKKRVGSVAVYLDRYPSGNKARATNRMRIWLLSTVTSAVLASPRRSHCWLKAASVAYLFGRRTVVCLEDHSRRGEGLEPGGERRLGGLRCSTRRTNWACSTSPLWSLSTWGNETGNISRINRLIPTRVSQQHNDHMIHHIYVCRLNPETKL